MEEGAVSGNGGDGGGSVRRRALSPDESKDAAKLKAFCKQP